ncbi:MAG: 6,7-dimethyl-8-ribityllumazine synthase [Planctomycetota bacterium]
MMNRIQVQHEAADLRVGIAVSRYNAFSTDPLLDGAVERFRRLGGKDDNLIIVPAAGTWELSAIALALANRPDIHAVVAIGTVIQGETPHFTYICQGVTHALAEVTLQTGKPVGYGVLTCDTAAQAEARSGGAVGNKGAEAMSAAVETACAIRALRQQYPVAGEGAL